MDKLHEVALFVQHYGYLAIFILVFLQEIGIPNPVTNELVLMFGGYLSYFHSLSLFKVIITVIAADVSGTCILFFTFYFFGKWLIQHKPKWLPIKSGALDGLKRKVNQRRFLGIFIGRLTPFLRGYISIAAGILHIEPKKFVTIVTLSALTWSGGLTAFGWLIAPYWNYVIQNMSVVENIFLLLIVITGLTFAGRYVLKKRIESKRCIEDPKPAPGL